MPVAPTVRPPRNGPIMRHSSAGIRSAADTPATKSSATAKRSAMLAELLLCQRACECVRRIVHIERHHLPVVFGCLRFVTELLVRLRDQAENERIPLIGFLQLRQRGLVVAAIEC